MAQLDGALWTLEGIESQRVAPESVPHLQRIVVAVDPSGASGEFDLASDEIGIVAAGRASDGHVYVLRDQTGLYSPESWGRVVCQLYHELRADRVIAEQNFGGDMVRAIIQGADKSVPYRHVVATRGKVIRAEPIAAWYERGLVHHVGRFPAMEDEMTNFTTGGYLGSRSPNRADALVWALTELFERNPGYGYLEYCKKMQAGIYRYGSIEAAERAFEAEKKSQREEAERKSHQEKPRNHNEREVAATAERACEAEREGQREEPRNPNEREGAAAKIQITEPCPNCGVRKNECLPGFFRCIRCGTHWPRPTSHNLPSNWSLTNSNG